MTELERKRISELFFEVCDLEEGERTRRLDEAFGDAPHLKREVLALLAGGDKTVQGELTGVVSGAFRDASTSLIDDEALRPTAIGPYTIVGEIGEGGMSVVFEAEQHEPVRRNVALKLIRPGMDTREVIDRFESERQALAMMDHSSIARIFDGGATDNGRPYFVMELVRGVPITQYCDEHRLSTPERLALFLSVCAAVQHAHQKGILHRDLKPSNILVAEEDGRAIPKVIDFGISKAVDVRGKSQPELTRFGQLIGTPSYMSPEQADPTAIDIDTRTDVYSLGVVLYELLVGSLPFEVDLSSEQSIQTTIRDTATPRPSNRFRKLTDTQSGVADRRRTEPRALMRVLASNLDWIVLKAMEKDRERRYQTVNALATDVEHYLDHRPISARPPSLTYAFGRFVRRHRTAVVVAGVVLVALIGGATLATIGFVRATQAERIAVNESRAAAEVTEFLVGTFEVPDPEKSLGTEVTAKEILDRRVATIEADLTGQPVVKAALMNAMARVYRNLNLYEDARPLFVAALELRRQAFGNDSLKVAETLHELAVLQQELNAYEAAIKAGEEAVAIRQRQAGEGSTLVAESLNTLGLAWYGQGDYDKAETLYRQALGIYETAAVPNREGHAVNLNNLAGLLGKRGDYTGAEALFRQSLAMRRELYGDEHPKVATALHNLGFVNLQAGDLDRAESYSRDALAMRLRLLDENHSDVGRTLNNLALTLRRKGDLAGAEPLYRQSIRVRKAVFGDSHAAVANGLNNLAGLLRSKGDLEQAEASYREAIETQRRLPRENRANTAIMQTNLAIVLTEQTRFAAACDEADAARAVLSDALGPAHWRVAVADSVRGACLAGSGEQAVAEPLLTDSLPVIREARGDRA
ncbi:MAG: serine/threonine-protein kinase, partial [Pseudomonadota bacterium]